jgi:hypothetical protein
MDPYLESHWRDIHHRFLTYACDDLQQYLPDSLRARLEERVFVEPELDEGHGIYPDVHLVERSPGEATEGFIEIVDVATGNRVVTVIELLSRSNKYAGEGQDEYRRTQKEYQRGGVTLVEIDLLRSGKRVLAISPSRIPKNWRTIYQVCITRGWKPRQYEIYRATMREPLPTIGVPLRKDDPIVPLSLQG